MAMVRKQVYIGQDLDKRLKREAKKRGVSEAEVIRGRLALDCIHTIPVDKETYSRSRFIEMLHEVREEALKVEAEGRTRHVKFNREDAYEERLDRQTPHRH